MEKIQLGLFEVFSYLFPGIIFLCGISLMLSQNINFPYSINDQIGGLNTSQVIMLGFISYFIGFCNQYWTFKIFKYLSLRIWKDRINEQNITLSNFTDKVSLIRMRSPESIIIIEKFMAFRGMCYNSFASIIFVVINYIIVVVRFSDSFSFSKVVFIMAFILLALLSLRRGITFHEWSVQNIDDSFNNLK